MLIRASTPVVSMSSSRSRECAPGLRTTSTRDIERSIESHRPVKAEASGTWLAGTRPYAIYCIIMRDMAYSNCEASHLDGQKQGRCQGIPRDSPKFAGI